MDSGGLAGRFLPASRCWEAGVALFRRGAARAAELLGEGVDWSPESGAKKFDKGKEVSRLASNRGIDVVLFLLRRDFLATVAQGRGVGGRPAAGAGSAAGAG